VGCGDGSVASRMTQWGTFDWYSHGSKTKEGKGLKILLLHGVIRISLVDSALCHGELLFFDRSMNV